MTSVPQRTLLDIGLNHQTHIDTIDSATSGVEARPLGKRAGTKEVEGRKQEGHDPELNPVDPQTTVAADIDRTRTQTSTHSERHDSTTDSAIPLRFPDVARTTTAASSIPSSAFPTQTKCGLSSSLAVSLPSSYPSRRSHL